MAKTNIPMAVIQDLAKKHSVKIRFIYFLLTDDETQRRYTPNIGLAIDLAELTGKAPINYVSKKKGMRDYAKIHFPGIDKVIKQRVHGPRVSDKA